MAKQKRANGRRYSDAEKAVAVQAVLASGGVVTTENWKQVQILIKAPTLSFDSLRLWMKAYAARKNEPQEGESRASSTDKVETLDFARAATLQIVEHTLRNYARRANERDAVNETEGKDAAKVMADMIKLEQLLNGMPTEIISIADDLMAVADLLRENDVELKPAIREWRERLERRLAAKRQASNG